MVGDRREGTRVAVLGPLLVRRGPADVTPAGAVPRRLLTLLASRAPHEVSTDHLVDVGWPGEPPRDPAANVHTHISRLRRLLDDGPGAGTAGAIRTCPAGYRLDTEVLAVDLTELDALCGPGLGAVDDAATTGRLDRALALWRGPSLHDIADAELGRSEAARLDELRLSLTEARFECLLAAGAGAEIVPELRAFTLDHPYRERPHAILMEALHDLGRQAEALETFQRLRRRLADDLGIDPSPELVSLEADVLGHRVPATAVRQPPGRAPTGGPSPVPAPVTPLVGRDAEAARGIAALDRARLVSVVGPGGVGKTRLAIEIARRATDLDPGRPVVWCDLTTVAHDDEVPEVVALTLPARRRHGETTTDAVADAVARNPPLLVLDNCEQVVDGVTALVARLLAAADGLHVVATTRAPLDLAGEHLLRLDPLACGPPDGGPAPTGPPGPATELFLARAAASGLDLEPDGATVDLIGHVCRAVDGLPLGIELAAAQLRNTTLAALAERLDDELGAIDLARRRGPDRHRSIRAALEWSYELLDPADRRLLATASTFPGSFGPDALARLAGEPDVRAVLDRLRELCDLSLVGVDLPSDGPRFRLLETTRRFGREVLAARGAEGGLAARHDAWVGELVERQSQRLRGPGEAAAARAIVAEWDSIRTALNRALAADDAGTALHLCCALGDFAFNRLRDDVCEWTDRAVGLASAEGHELHARGLASLALGLTSRGDLDRATTIARQVIEIGRPDAIAQIVARHTIALTALYAGDLGGARAAAGEMLAVAESGGDTTDVYTALVVTALACTYDGDGDGARRWAERGATVAAADGSPSAAAWSSYGLGEVLTASDPERAASLFERAMEVGASVDSTFVVGVAQVSLTTLRATTGDIPTAMRTFDHLIRHWLDGNDWTHQWTTLQNVAPLLHRDGAFEETAVLVGALTAPGRARPLFGDAAERINRLDADLADRLDPDELAAHRRRGAALSHRELVSFVLAAVAGRAGGA